MVRGLLAGLSALILLAAFTPTHWYRQAQPEPVMKSVHLFDLPASVTEEELVTSLRRLNEAVRSTGHTEAGYTLWRVTEAQVDEYAPIGHAYVMEGIWPSRSTYDEIHESAAWQEARDAFVEVAGALADVQLYSRYGQVPVGGPGES